MNTRKRIIIVSLFIFGILPFQLFCQAPDGFEITGHIDGLQDGLIVKLYHRNGPDWHIPHFMDSCISKNGNFYLKTKEKVPEGPRIYRVMFFKGPNEDLITDPQEINFMLDNGDKITISADISPIPGPYGPPITNIKISGNKANDAMIWANNLVSYADSCQSKIKHNLNKIVDSIGYDRALVEEQVNAKRKLDKYLDSATRNMPSGYQVIVPYLIITLHDILEIYHGYFQKDLYTKLSPTMQNGFFGQQARNMAALCIGQSFPEFSLPTPEGNKIALKEFLRKDKITLIHFWGPGCVDGDKYQNELKVLYNKFHDKGLNVIAVSADTTRDDWEFRIHQKKYPWTNVLAEPKGWGKGSLINDVYGEGGHYTPNTTNVLLDGNGKILAWDVYGPELQWYLENYLVNNLKLSQ